MNKRLPIIRFLFLTVFVFAAGFFTHALFFPYLFTDNFAIVIPAKAGNVPVSPVPNKSVTEILYVDGQFSPKVVQIKKSYYVNIINMSEKELMWLTSKNTALTTPRGFAKSEQLRTILYDPGVYEVSTTLHPTEKLQIIVK